MKVMLGHKETEKWQEGDYVHLRDGRYWVGFDEGSKEGSVAVVVDRKTHLSYLMRWDEVPDGCLLPYKEEPVCIV